MRATPVAKLADLLNGRLAIGNPNSIVSSVSIDSRRIAEGEVFIALKGERYDGHDYIISSIESGAAGVVAQRLTIDQRKVIAERSRFAILVDDTLKALQSLAHGYRRTLQVKCVAVTGSTGKTTVKDMIRAVLSAFVRTVATEGNLNNEIGLPLTVLRAADDTQVLVVEMGMRGLGQIEALCRIAEPDIGVVTNVNDTHIELLGSREQIARAKQELVEAIPESGGVVLNGDDPLVLAMAAKCRGRVVTVGTGVDCDIRATDICSMGAAGIKFRVSGADPLQEVRVGLPGVHNVHNALLALGVCKLLGYPLEIGARRLETLSVSNMRMAVKPTAKGVTIIDDSYNASPASMLAALKTLADVGSGGRTIAVLGDMLELGHISEAAHRQIGCFIAEAGPNFTFTVGRYAGLICEEVRKSCSSRVCESYSTRSEVIRRLKEILKPGDTVLVKGSRAMHMDEIVDALVSYLA